MKLKYKILIALFGCLVFIIFLDKLIKYNFAFYYAIFFLIFPIISIIDLFEFYFDVKNNKLLAIRNKTEKIIKGYFIPLAGLFYALGFLHLRQTYWNENFDVMQLKVIDITIGISAFLSLLIQIGHLLLILKSKFVGYNFTTYLILFFLSYIICGLSFGTLYCLDINSLKNINPDHKTFDTIYFSFVTLATTGFGDITANSILTKTFVILENIIGLFFTGYIITMIFNSYRKN